MFDDFSKGFLDTTKWDVMNSNWGGTVIENGVEVDYNGGVVSDNLSFKNGNILFTGNGNYYEGPVKGINSDLTPRKDGKRCGAVIYTKEFFGSGSYEVRAKFSPDIGSCIAFWTFEYMEEASGHKVNHEVDIEFPGHHKKDFSDVSFDTVLFTTWQGLEAGEHDSQAIDLTKNYADGEFHTFRIDWHTGDEEKNEKARVEYYFDNEFMHVTDKNIPTNVSQFYVGIWFPKEWTGVPNFDTSVLEVDYVKITPFFEKGDTPHKG